MKVIELPPVHDGTEEWEKIEKYLIALFKTEIYLPLLKMIDYKPLKNSMGDSPSHVNLIRALQTGRVTYNKGIFSGKFNSSITKELRSLGAKWNAKASAFYLPKSRLPNLIKSTISLSESAFREKLNKLDKKLEEILPEKIADKVNVSNIFDTALFKVDKNIQKTLKNITVAPSLTKDQRKVIADEWNNNMKLWVQDFTKKEIQTLRDKVKTSAFAGNRYENLIGQIQKSYGVSHNKAKFLARQETKLLMVKLKEVRYKDAGVTKYKWKCVVGSPAHPVRPFHKKLEDRIFSWDDPPITDPDGSRNNPGQDFNCRCYAKPIIEF